MYVRRGSPEWTQRSRLVCEAYLSGRTIRGIAQDMGLAYGTVHRLLTQAGVRRRPPGFPARVGEEDS